MTAGRRSMTMITMMKSLAVASLAAAAMLTGTQTAKADHNRISFGIGFNTGGYYRPAYYAPTYYAAPVYYQPAPVYYAPQAYCPPAPVYYSTPTYYAPP